MTDTQTETKAKRALAEHGLRNANGGEVDDFAEADSVTYRHLATGGEFEWSWSEANEDEKRMLGLFGARTLMTNEASQVKQRKGGKIDPTQAIQDRFSLLRGNPPQWVDRTREGFAINIEAMAQAVFAVLTKAGKAVTYEKILERVTEDKEFVKSAKSNPEISAKYVEIVGRPTTSVDDLAAGLA